MADSQSSSPPGSPNSRRLRPPTFERRFAASATSDPDALVALASDDSYWVRRQALKNPATPRWILELLVRAGATPDLRGKGEPDPTLEGEALRTLVEAGPWARQLVAEHPNTPAYVLDVLVDQPSASLRLALARHPNASGAALARLACDAETGVRAAATSHPNVPVEIVGLLAASGAGLDPSRASRPEGELDEGDLRALAELGPWGRYLAARHPACPADLLGEIARDPDWRIRSGLLDNPNTPDALLAHLLGTEDADELASLRELNRANPPASALQRLAQHPNPEVRMAVARHPAVGPELLGVLASDGTREVRRFVVDNPNTRAKDVALLVRAGSTPDLMGLSEPDLAMGEQDLDELSRRGLWARQLAVRHPNTAPDTLARLLCDAEPKIREWAAVHTSMPQETIQALIRAGSGTDFQGFMPPDPDVTPEGLRRLAALGSWAQWVAAVHPNAPLDLLEELAGHEDARIRQSVARHPRASRALLARLAQDSATEVRRVVAARCECTARADRHA
jgi:hypothetical protein